MNIRVAKIIVPFIRETDSGSNTIRAIAEVIEFNWPKSIWHIILAAIERAVHFRINLNAGLITPNPTFVSKHRSFIGEIRASLAKGATAIVATPTVIVAIK
jgi:hypothetical protein